MVIVTASINQSLAFLLAKIFLLLNRMMYNFSLFITVLIGVKALKGMPMKFLYEEKEKNVIP